MTKKLYVGNLSFQATEGQVRDLFAEYGDVESIAWITDRDTGRFRGFCFVEMNDAGASEAIDSLDGQDFEGRALKVNEARPKENRGGGGGYNNRRGGGGGSGYGRNNNSYGGGSRW